LVVGLVVGFVPLPELYESGMVSRAPARITFGLLMWFADASFATVVWYRAAMLLRVSPERMV
jgi:hypothetical protein